jgi:uncharacterized phage-associated protein
MVSALDVARYLIHLASPEETEDADCLSPLRLQKLLYYAQGWHLAAYGTPLFTGRIEAWTYGPVVREVYQNFRDYRCQGIPPNQGWEPDNLSARQKAFIRSVWEEYKRYSVTALIDMTHSEAPWRTARGPLGPSEGSDAEITPESLRSFFEPLLKEKLVKADPRINLSIWQKSAEAIAAGKTQTLEDIRGALRRGSAGTDPR